jgi:hypothetical protein
MTWGEGRYVSPKVKATVRRRDKTCRLAYEGICTTHIDEFDHPDNLASQGLARTSVLSACEVQGVCRPCHKVKTEAERQAGRAKAIATRGGLSRRLRDREPHPGHSA